MENQDIFDNKKVNEPKDTGRIFTMARKRSFLISSTPILHRDCPPEIQQLGLDSEEPPVKSLKREPLPIPVEDIKVEPVPVEEIKEVLIPVEDIKVELIPVDKIKVEPPEIKQEMVQAKQEMVEVRQVKTENRQQPLIKMGKLELRSIKIVWKVKNQESDESNSSDDSSDSSVDSSDSSDDSSDSSLDSSDDELDSSDDELDSSDELDDEEEDDNVAGKVFCLLYGCRCRCHDYYKH